jgi:hypothetical protein
MRCELRGGRPHGIHESLSARLARQPAKVVRADDDDYRPPTVNAGDLASYPATSTYEDVVCGSGMLMPGRSGEYAEYPVAVF